MALSTGLNATRSKRKSTFAEADTPSKRGKAASTPDACVEFPPVPDLGAARAALGLKDDNHLFCLAEGITLKNHQIIGAAWMRQVESVNRSGGICELFGGSVRLTGLIHVQWQSALSIS